ncbi:hypothetical protein EC80586_3114, partial [Escherichia coli 8.0586]
MMVPSF